MRTIPILLAIAIALAACTPGNAPVGPSLAGTQWVLQAMPGWEMGKVAQVPTLVFQSETRGGGRSGCNSWDGAYEHRGAKIRFSEMMMTEMACENGMDVEQLYVRALEKNTWHHRDWRYAGPFRRKRWRTRTLLPRLTERAAIGPRAVPTIDEQCTIFGCRRLR